MTPFTPAVIEAARADAILMYPYESCGVVVGGRYIACQNVAEEPEKTFRIAGRVWVDHPGIEGVIHSHGAEDALDQEAHPPGHGLDAPSEADMRGQEASGVPWGIVVTDGTGTRPFFDFGPHRLWDPLLRRSWRAGVTDCYELVRSVFLQERGIALPSYPRDDAWWDDGKDLFVAHFKEAGFEEIGRGTHPPANLEPYDCVLAAVPRQGETRAEAPINHCGVYRGNGLVLHHLPGRLSRPDQVGRYRSLCRYWLRYVG